MKKVLLTKSQHVQRVANGGDPLYKNPPTPPAQPVRAIALPNSAQISSSTYIQRKIFKTVYEDIFKLLMRIPDKALHQRVIDAMNGHNINDKATISHQGKQCYCGKQKVNASTQTETDLDGTIEAKVFFAKFAEKPAIKHESAGFPEAPKAPSPGPNSTSIASPAQPVKVPKKRGRKRNTCVPKVVKRSAAEMAMQEREEKQLTPVVTKKRRQDVTNSANTLENRYPKTPLRRNSTMSDISINLDDLERVDNYIEKGNSADQIKKIMANEFRKARIMSPEGLLPIHEEILHSDIYGIKRQMFVYSHLKMDINDMLSNDGEDCLQLALTNDTDPEIVSLVLSAGCLTNNLYDNSNTVLHLAVINNVNLKSIKELMQRIDLNLLLQTNDDGYTVLHLAVRHNQFYVAEAILDSIDQRQLNEPVYRREIEAPNTDGRDEKAFAKYYDRACERLELNKHKLKNRVLKMSVINASEARAGNTPLFYAVEGEQEHLCYFLLAHLADPDEENLSGHSPKSFHYEYARILRINLKVSRVMDKVIDILKT
ncbi:hypothetical protein KR009_008742 [Drosophila setifemur]|nr:hypothetical protein KR009_008742 [Drosophila setifemur]